MGHDGVVDITGYSKGSRHELAEPLRCIGNTSSLVDTRGDDQIIDASTTALVYTESPDLLLLLAGDRLQQAICRRCPHMEADLAVHGTIDPHTARLACRHRRYEWDLPSGRFVGDPAAAGAADLPVVPVGVTADGRIWVSDVATPQAEVA